MRITVDNVQALLDATEELSGPAEEWLEMQEDRSSYEAEEIADVRAALEEAINELKGLLK